MSPNNSKDKSVALFMFDLDGTLVNTVDAIVINANRARSTFGFKERPVSDIEELVGLNPVHFFDDLVVGKAEVDHLVKIFRKNLNAHFFTADDIYPGVRDILNFLRDNDFELAVATNKPTQNAKLLLEKVGLLNFFTHVQGSDNLASKPAPDILIACQNNFHSSRIFMVGDRVEDVVAGLRSGATTIGIAQTSHSLQQFREANTNFAFSDLISLLNFLDSDDGLARLFE